MNSEPTIANAEVVNIDSDSKDAEQRSKKFEKVLAAVKRINRVRFEKNDDYHEKVFREKRMERAKIEQQPQTNQSETTEEYDIFALEDRVLDELNESTDVDFIDRLIWKEIAAIGAVLRESKTRDTAEAPIATNSFQEQLEFYQPYIQAKIEDASCSVDKSVSTVTAQRSRMILRRISKIINELREQPTPEEVSALGETASCVAALLSTTAADTPDNNTPMPFISKRVQKILKRMRSSRSLKSCF